VSQPACAVARAHRAARGHGVLGQGGGTEREWVDALDRAIDKYELVAFGAKIRPRPGGSPVREVVVIEPIEGDTAERVDPGRLGGTRHLSTSVRLKPDTTYNKPTTYEEPLTAREVQVLELLPRGRGRGCW